MISPKQVKNFKRFYEPYLCDRDRLRCAVETESDVNGSNVGKQMMRYEKRKSGSSSLDFASLMII